jgi:hypothetical protein
MLTTYSNSGFHPLYLIHVMMEGQVPFQKLPPATVLPGLASLRSLALAIPHTLCGSEYAFTYNHSLIESLLKLPALKDLYLDFPFSALYPSKSSIKPRSSPLEHVFLDSNEMGKPETQALILGCKALKSFGYRSRHRNGCFVLVVLLSAHRDTLECLDLCGSDAPWNLQNRCIRNPLTAGLRAFPKLKHAKVDLISLPYLSLRNNDNGRTFTLDSSRESQNLDLTMILPTSAETVTFLLSPPYHYLSNDAARALDRDISRVVHSCRLPRLQAIFFLDLLPYPGVAINTVARPNVPTDRSLEQVISHRQGACGGDEWFSSTIAAGGVFGIDVYTSLLYSRA